VIRAAARLRRHEGGFSLIELLAAMAIGSIVLTALMTVFINGLTGAARVTDRIEAVQRGRVALDRMVGLLDSQVCVVSYDATLNTEVTTTPVLAASDSNQVTFSADLSGASDSPDRYRFVYSPTAKSITEYRYDGAGRMPNITFPAVASATRVLATNVIPAKVGGVPTGAPLPIFQYYRFVNSAIDAVPLTTPLSATDAATVVRVGVQFQAVPERTKAEDPRKASLQGQGNVLTANPVNNTVC
jgi:prepilin-type N-terminal cleavage/methylation domain-containing protein